VLATMLVLGITVLDLIAYGGVKAEHGRARGTHRRYSDRSGLPRGPQARAASRARTSRYRRTIAPRASWQPCCRRSLPSRRALGQAPQAGHLGGARTDRRRGSAAVMLLFLADIFRTVLYARAEAACPRGSDDPRTRTP
jgi:hypothetical protein